MSDAADGPLIVAVDDDPGVLKALERSLTRGDDGHDRRFVGFERPTEALAYLEEHRPDLVLLDVLMPEMSGYELCSELLSREELEYVPVVFVTVLGEEEDRARAFQAGAVDVVVKPFDVEEIRARVREHLDTEERWRELEEGASPAERLFDPSAWSDFKAYLTESVEASAGDARRAVEEATPDGLYDLCEPLELSERILARYVADFLEVPSLPGLSPEDVEAGVLPAPFCRANLVIPVATRDEGRGAVLSNPFDWELMENLRKTLWHEREPAIYVAEPDVIESFFTYGEGGEPELVEEVAESGSSPDLNADRVVEKEEDDPATHEVMALANELLRRAVAERASDVHVEPKREGAVVRYRIDGELTEVRRVTGARARRLIARFKALGDLDVADRRSPQDGALEAVVRGRRFKLRLATTATPHGESLVIRLLEPYTDAPTPEQLGMTEEQAATLRRFASASAGLVLVVGPTGAGKSTTVFSLLSEVDSAARSVITVEDPVEYQIPFANQQQVNERAGVTFESLLKSAVRQDPDILLLGEIRDGFSAKASMDFASSGHLTVTTVHSANATTSVFRLERLGLERGAMADSVLGIVAQRLLRTLCSKCRTVRPITGEERELLEPFTDDVPEEVAEGVGCPACRQTGFRGRTGVFEVLRFDEEVSSRVRSGVAVSEIRRYVSERGDFLIADHAVEKVRDLLCTPDQVYRAVLSEEAEESGQPEATGRTGGPEPEPEEEIPDGSAAESGGDGDHDGPEARLLVQRYLETDGHEVVPVGDGVEALLHLGRRAFDLVISDIRMPNLDGLQLLDLMSEKDMDVPVVFLTAADDDTSEARSLEMGAEEFLAKPVRKDVLSLRIRKVLRRIRSGGG